jgi:hypothetical protein
VADESWDSASGERDGAEGDQRRHDGAAEPQRDLVGQRDELRHDPEHVERAQQAIALITAFVGVPEHGSLKAAGLLNQLMGEDPHPEYLLSAVAAIGAVLVRDLARATDTSPEAHLQALGRAAALLQVR